MRTILTLTLLCLALFSIQAQDNWAFLRNYLKRTYQDTHFRNGGSITPNANNTGYDINYGAGLYYKDLGITGFDLSLGVIPDVQTLNLTLQNSTFKYSGNLVLNNNTNVTISGTTGITNVIDAAYDDNKQTASITLKQSISDNSSFVAKNGTTQTLSKNTQAFNLNSTISQLRDTFKTQHSGSYSLTARGSVTDNGTSLGAFTLIDSANGTSNQTVLFFPNQILSMGRSNDARGCGKPKVENVAAVAGKNAFSVGTYYSFQGGVNTTSLNGTARNDGYIGIRGSDLLVLGSATYTTVRADFVNSSLVNTTQAYGVADTLTIYRNSTIVNGTSSNLTHTGKLLQQMTTTMNTTPKPTTAKAVLKAGWTASDFTTNQVTSNVTNLVNTTKSFNYATKKYNNINNFIRDCDDRKNPPTISSGNPTLSASFKTTTTSSSIEDVEFKLFDDNFSIIDVDGALDDN